MEAPERIWALTDRTWSDVDIEYDVVEYVRADMYDDIREDILKLRDELYNAFSIVANCNLRHTNYDRRDG